MKRTPAPSWKPLLLGLSALVVAVLVFVGTSGVLAFSPLSELASVLASVTGQASVSITRDGSSPSGSIAQHYVGKLAAFKVTARAVSTSATVSNITLSANVSAPSSVTLSNLTADYQYCFKSGTTYGYGYPGGHCGTVSLPVSLSSNGSGYTIALSGSIPVYPQQSSGVITLYGNADGKGSTRDATVKITIATASAYATGDQCRTIHYGLRNRYGYSKCSPVRPVVNASGSVSLSMKIPKYGYGPTVITPPVTRPILPVILPKVIIDRFPKPTP